MDKRVYSYTYTPVRKDKGRNALIISSLLYICAAVSWGAAIFDIGYRMISQVAAAVSLVIGIFISARYSLTDFKYMIQCSESVYGENTADFTVIKIQGKKSKTVCRLSLETAVAVIPKIKLSALEAKYGAIERKFNYRVNLFANDNEIYYYIFEFNGKYSVIEFEADKAFIGHFKDSFPASNEI